MVKSIAVSVWYERVVASSWFGPSMKALGLALLIVPLGLLGAGVFDARVAPWFDLPSARAKERVTTSPRAPALASSAAPAGLAPGELAAPHGSASATAAAPKATTADGKTILNLASEADLVKLPGVGKKRAQAILALREKLGGRFRRIEDLMRVRGIKRKALAKLKPLVVLDAPQPDAPESAAPGPSAPEAVPSARAGEYAPPP